MFSLINLYGTHVTRSLQQIVLHLMCQIRSFRIRITDPPPFYWLVPGYRINHRPLLKSSYIQSQHPFKQEQPSLTPNYPVPELIDSVISLLQTLQHPRSPSIQDARVTA